MTAEYGIVFCSPARGEGHLDPHALPGVHHLARAVEAVRQRARGGSVTHQRSDHTVAPEHGEHAGRL